MNFIDEMISFVIIVLVPIAILIALTLLGGNYYGQYTCNNYAAMTGHTTQFVNFDECYVKTDSGFQRWDEYKARVVASEMLQRAPAK